MLDKLELGAKGRKPFGQDTTRTKARNRCEYRELTGFPAKAWFKGTPWDGLIKTVLKIERIVDRRSAETGLWTRSLQTAFYISSAEKFTPAQWSQIIRNQMTLECGVEFNKII